MANSDSGRYALVRAAVEDEMSRFNAKAKKMKPTLFIGCDKRDHIVEYVDSSFWIHTYPVGTMPSFTNKHSWALCNDGRWAELMKKVGEPRNPLFA